MSNVIEDLYFEKLEANPAGYNENSKIGKMTSEIRKIEDILLNRLDCDEKKWFLKYAEVSTDRNSLVNVEEFSRSFRLGARFMKEICCDEN